jgi:hypothetical protein
MIGTRMSRRLRTTALLAVGMLVVHHAPAAFAQAVPGLDPGQHDYLSIADSLAGLLVILAVVAGAVEARFRGRSVAPRPRSLRYLAIRDAAVLAVLYVLQESLEAICDGRPVDLATIVVQHHGWVAIALSPLVALAIAAIEHVADRVVAAMSRPLRTIAPTRATRTRRQAVEHVWQRRLPQADAPSRAPPSFA